MKSSKRIAVVACAGELPLRLIEKLVELRRDFVVISIKGFGPSADDLKKAYPVDDDNFFEYHLGEIEKVLNCLRVSQASELVLAGSIKRPSFRSLKLDETGKKWLWKLGPRAFLGDDSLLKGLKKLLNDEGFKIVSPHSIMDNLLTPSGVLTSSVPDDVDLEDIARGVFVLQQLSKADVGQAVIVQEGIVLGIEAAEGTQKLIERIKDLKINDSGGVLVKTSKIDQLQDIDLPTIGEETMNQLKESGLNGIALSQGSSQIINYEKTIQLANELELFIIGI